MVTTTLASPAPPAPPAPPCSSPVSLPCTAPEQCRPPPPKPSTYYQLPLHSLMLTSPAVGCHLRRSLAAFKLDGIRAPRPPLGRHGHLPPSPTASPTPSRRVMLSNPSTCQLYHRSNRRRAPLFQCTTAFIEPFWPPPTATTQARHQIWVWLAMFYPMLTLLCRTITGARHSTVLTRRHGAWIVHLVETSREKIGI